MKLLLKLLHLSVLLINFQQSAFAWRSFKIVFNTFTYEYKHDVLDVNAKIRNVTEDTTINVALNVLKDLNDVQLTFVIILEGEDNAVLINRTFSGCKQHTQEPLLRLIQEEMVRQGNFIKSCPIKKGRYTLPDYRLDEELLPSYIPETTFLVFLTVAHEEDVIFNGTLAGEIDKSKGFNNLKMFSLG